MPAKPWWAKDSSDLFQELESQPGGLTALQVSGRPLSTDRAGRHWATLRLFVSQFTTPLVLILIVGAVLSLALREWTDAAIILCIIAGSGLLGFTQEYSASKAIEELRQRLVRQVRVLRDGKVRLVPLEEVIPGDICLLRAGDLVPGDGRVLDSQDLLVDEAVLTGEPYPVEKTAGPSPEEAPLSQRNGALFNGTSVRSGSCTMLVVKTGKESVFGGIEDDLEKAEEVTEFAKGLSAFGKMLMRVMLVVVLIVLGAAALLGRDLMTSILFAMALAVAISPELLPAIVSVTLAAGARRMTQHGVLVRRLEAIENLGGMDILCTDKTGTLTMGAIGLSAAVDPSGQASPDVLRLAAINAQLQTAMQSALDEAVLAAASAANNLPPKGISKRRDIAYDFSRRRYSVEVNLADGTTVFITKGAVNEVLSACTSVLTQKGPVPLDPSREAALQELVRSKAENGFRVLAVSQGEEPAACLCGFLLFFDPLKPDIEKTVSDLRKRGISVRIISGDNRHVCARMAALVGLPEGDVLTGEVIAALDDASLTAKIRGAHVFAEVEPQDKERLVRAFQGAGHAVGYMGDGINDAPALRAADVGISVDTAVDVARESADIVLLRPDLRAILRGVEDGRRTFANTLKYVAITISANFGNMVSMALATIMLPFLPLLPVQILLNNFLSDLPAITIASDAVDKERLAHAQRWDIDRIRTFMILFGTISTVFDLLTFGLLHFGMKADPETFRTSWFVVSLLTELVALLVLRTARRSWRSKPSGLLFWSSVFVAVIALALPFGGQVADLFSLNPIPLSLLAQLIALVLGYGIVTEIAKRHYHIQVS